MRQPGIPDRFCCKARYADFLPGAEASKFRRRIKTGKRGFWQQTPMLKNDGCGLP